jgi:hypothetical protein
MSYRYNKSAGVITELCHLRNIKITGINPLDVIKFDIRKKPAHCYDIEDIAKFRNLEKIYMLTDEQHFVLDLIKNIDLFENLYELSVKFRIDEPPYLIEIVDSNCHDISNVLLIKKLESCSFNHKEGEEESTNCVNCIAMNSLRNTVSANCVIQNFTNDYLLNSMSSEIKKLIIVVLDPTKLELTNLPYFLQKITIVYKKMQTPNEFYAEHKSKIKLPYGCKLKIIQDYDVFLLEISKRHLNIDDDY